MKRQAMQEEFLLFREEMRVFAREWEGHMLGRVEERDRQLIKRLEGYEQSLRARERRLDERDAQYERTLGETATHFTQIVLQALDMVGPGSDFRTELVGIVAKMFAKHLEEQHGDQR